MSKSIFDNGNIYCINCGEYNHKKKNCPEPIISYGIILFRKNDNNELEYLLIKRKDTISYIHLIRGKYDLENIDTILTLLKELSNDEKKRIFNINFEVLWNEMWSKKKNEKKTTELINCENQFNRLLQVLKKNKLCQNEIKNYKWIDTEWGFPKGRRNYKESNLVAAKREFNEETDICLNDIDIKNIDVIKEEYIGNDDIIYRHEYYVAEFKKKTEVKINKENTIQLKEVSDLKFMNLDNCLKNIRENHIEKKKIIISVDEQLKKLYI